MTTAETSLKDVLQQNRIQAEENIIHQKIHFSLESLQALNISEEKHFWTRIRQSLVESLIRRYSKTPSAILDIGCGNGTLIRHLSTTFPSAKLAGMNLARNICPVRQIS